MNERKLKIGVISEFDFFPRIGTGSGVAIVKEPEKNWEVINGKVFLETGGIQSWFHVLAIRPPDEKDACIRMTVRPVLDSMGDITGKTLYSMPRGDLPPAPIHVDVRHK